MTNLQIKNEIQKLYQRNTEILKQGYFVLNEEIQENLDEIQILQSQCSHSYNNGKCIYCGKGE